MIAIPFWSYVPLGLNALAAFAIPAALYLALRKKYGCRGLFFWVGCAVMLVFAFGLEQLAHYYVLYSPLGLAINASIGLTALYGGLMAGLFEECGRFFAYKILGKKLLNDRDALMYGAGHGGLELFVILLMGAANGFGSLSESVVALAPLALLERLAAITAQLSLSVLVWFAAKRGGRSLWLLPLAILLHALLDAVAVLMAGLGANALLIELAICLMAAAIAIIARTFYKRLSLAD